MQCHVNHRRSVMIISRRVLFRYLYLAIQLTIHAWYIMDSVTKQSVGTDRAPSEVDDKLSDTLFCVSEWFLHLLCNCVLWISYICWCPLSRGITGLFTFTVWRLHELSPLYSIMTRSTDVESLPGDILQLCLCLVGVIWKVLASDFLDFWR